MINLNFTMIVKRSIGKLRPFTYRFCNLDRYCSEGSIDRYISTFECINKEFPFFIDEPRESFFSGHSALGTFAGIYLNYFLHTHFYSAVVERQSPNSSSKSLRKYLFFIAQILLLILSMIPGYTQYINNWHFLSDILVGFVVGSTIAFLHYRLTFKR
ncbi:Phospholipid phosphatase 3 [Sarcoptes scabiei]|nr:Phospholipid phosphatase 3 [Sarcoptes scabiei]